VTSTRETSGANVRALATDPRVLREQVAAQYASLLISTIAGTTLACALSAILYWQLRDPLILPWLSLLFLNLLRYPHDAAYHRDPKAAERSAIWAARRNSALLIYSAIWGLAPWLFMPANNLPMTVLMMLIILGLSSGGVPAVAQRWSTVLSFVVPMVASLITALAWRADAIHLFLAGCTAVYLGATLHFARLQNRLLTDALLARFEKEALADELAQQVAIARRASKEKTRFFAAASHDLRQPLHAIALFGAVLQKELQGHPAHTNATRLMRAVHALGTSLDTMLDISRLDAGVIEPQMKAVALSPLLQSINQMFASRAEEKGLQLRVRASQLWVQTDPELLERLLANLVENAIKYTTQGGVLVVARQRDHTVWIDVRDTGIGIAPEQREQIFDEYYQGHNPGRDRSQGLGIGLSIVRRLSTLLDHPVLVQSRAGHGTRFRIVVPTAPARQNSAAPPHLLSKLDFVNTLPPLEDSDLPQRVLLIDDELDIGDALTALLGSYGVALQVVRDEAGAQAALKQAAAQGLHYDALLCDYRLGDGAD
jgi:signal transduction histidine kinase